MALLQVRNTEELIRNIKSCSLDQNSGYQKGKIKYVSNKISEGVRDSGEKLIN